MKYKRTLGLDAVNDIDRDGQGKFYFLDGLAAVEEELKLTLQTVEGEQPFAEDFGLDVFEIAGASTPVIKREIRLTLIRDSRVASVVDVTVDRNPENRTAVVTIALTLVDGQGLTLNGVELNA